MPKFTITLTDAPNNMVNVEFKPSIAQIMSELGRTKKCTPAEEMVLLAAEMWRKRSDKEKDRRVFSKTGLILPPN